MAIDTSIKRGYNKDIGYKIPAVVDPNDAICVRVYVPKDTLYIGAFWSAYQDFTSWIVWERDAQHRAKDAAAVWKFWFDMARAEYDAEGGVCGVNDIRQKPDYPCIVQKRLGGTWLDAVDMRLCTRLIRYGTGGQIEMWDGTQWVPAGENETTGDSYDPRTDLANEITHPAVGEGQNPACISAINAVTYLSRVIDYSMVQLKDLGLVVRVVDFVVTFFIQPVANFMRFVMKMDDTFNRKLFQITNLCLLAEDAVIAYDVITPSLCYFVEAYDGDQHMSAIKFAALIENLNNEAGSHTGPEARKWELLECYVEGLGRIWMGNIANESGITEYECECGCQNVDTYDFASNGQQGWTLDFPGDMGAWSGSGWINTWPGSTYDGVSIKSPAVYEGEHICKVEFYFDRPTGEDNNAPTWYARCAPNYDQQSSWQGGNVTYMSLDCNIDVPIGGSLSVAFDAYSGGEQEYDAVLNKIVVTWG